MKRIVRHSRSGSAAKRVFFYLEPVEIETLDQLAAQFDGTNGVPVSRSLVVRRSIELLKNYAMAAGKISLPSRGKFMVRNLEEA